MSVPLPDRQRMVKTFIRSSNRRLQIRFTYPSKVKNYISVGLKDDRLGEVTNSKIQDDDHTLNINIARGLAAQLQKDILNGCYDPTHAKYKILKETESSNSLKIQSQQNSLLSIWEQYFDYKKQTEWAASTIKDYRVHTKRIAQLPDLNWIEQPHLIQDYLLELYSAETTRRTIQQINAACTWAWKRNLLTVNPFLKLDKLKRISGTRGISNKAFYIEEVREIIDAFRFDSYCLAKSAYKHSYYTNYVRFMFLTGTRPEEAIEVRRKDILNSAILIERSNRIDIGVINKDVKNHKKRKFPINAQLQEIIDTRLPFMKHKEALLFPGRKGGSLNYNNFNRNNWKPIILKLYEAKKISQILPPYNCKHTFISHSLANKVSPKQLEAWTGVSSKVISEHYASIITNAKPPSLYL